MPPDVLPPDVIEVLAYHGPVDISAGAAGSPARGKLHVAPFEDALFLLAPTNHPIGLGLLERCAMEIRAADPAGSWKLRLNGRAHAGRSLSRHPRRASLRAWVPEELLRQPLDVIPFIAEEVEFIRGEGEERRRFAGPTPAAPPPRWRSLLRAALGGPVIPFTVLAVALPWFWLGFFGEEIPRRGVALLFAIVGAWCGLGGLRLALQVRGYVLWRGGMARESDAPALVEARLAPREGRRLAAVLLASAAFAYLLLGVGFGLQVLLACFLSSGAWLLGPAGLLHLSAREPDPGA